MITLISEVARRLEASAFFHFFILLFLITHFENLNLNSTNTPRSNAMCNSDETPVVNRESSLTVLRDLKDCMLHRYEENDGHSPQTRIVLVLGAEASRASCLQEWKSFGESLVDNLSGHYQHRTADAFLDDALTKLQPLIGPAPAGFENRKKFLKENASPEQILEVACGNTIFERYVRKQLELAYGPQKAPQLGYELIAHLLRHRFVDHVVSFNWDEILDRAIDDEIGEDGYEKILPAARSQRSGMERRVPRLFKLHGTATSPDSLRFTTAETGLLSLGIMELLDEALFGIKVDESLDPSDRCHLVSFGYGLSDPDFVNYIVARWDRFERITVVRQSASYPEEIRRLFCMRYKEERFWEEELRKRKVVVVSTAALSVVDNSGRWEPLVDHLLWSLWELIKKDKRIVTGELRLTPAARHILLGTYFAPRHDVVVLPLKSDPTDYRSERGRLFEYSEIKRLRIEFMLHVMKSNGMINLSPMGRDPRISGALHRAGNARTLYQLLDDERFFEPSPGSAMRETYFLRPLKKGAADGDQKTSEILRAGARRVAAALEIDRMAGHTISRPVWKETELTFERIDLSELFYECAAEIFEADDVEIKATPDPRNGILFVSPKPITSFARLSKESSDLLEGSWDVLLVVAESGRWIFRSLAEVFEIHERSQRKKKRIFLVRTSNRDLDTWAIGGAYDVDIERQIQSLEEKQIHTFSTEIPWWRHNRHMTLALHRHEERYLLGNGIYFRRRLKNHRIAPVLVGGTDAAGKADCFELVLLFYSYVKRALDWHRTNIANSEEGYVSAGRSLENFVRNLEIVVDKIECERGGRCESARLKLAREIQETFLTLGGGDLPT